YADTITDSMLRAIDETNRRRRNQMEYNEKHGITPETAEKAVRDIVQQTRAVDEQARYAAAAEKRTEDMSMAQGALGGRNEELGDEVKELRELLLTMEVAG